MALVKLCNELNRAKFQLLKRSTKNTLLEVIRLLKVSVVCALYVLVCSSMPPQQQVNSANFVQLKRTTIRVKHLKEITDIILYFNLYKFHKHVGDPLSKVETYKQLKVVRKVNTTKSVFPQKLSSVVFNFQSFLRLSLFFYYDVENSAKHFSCYFVFFMEYSVLFWNFYQGVVKNNIKKFSWLSYGYNQDLIVVFVFF